MFEPKAIILGICHDIFVASRSVSLNKQKENVLLLDCKIG